MEKKHLLKSQMNDIFEIINFEGLEPFSFEWSYYESSYNEYNEIQVLEFKDSEFFFSFDVDYYNEWNISFSPGEEKLVQTVGNRNYWGDVTTYFRVWLNCLKKEIGEPDLWREVNKYNSGFTVELENEDDYFTIDEAKRIAHGVNSVRTYLIEQAVKNENHLQIINNKMDYLIQSSERMGKKDWKNIFIGTLTSLFTTLSMEPEKAKSVLLLFRNALGGIIKLIGG